MSAFDADWQAAEDFGNIQEIAVELARGYPPKRPIETSRVRWLPELGLAAMLLCAGYAYHIYGGMRGVEEACASTNSAMAMLVVPGMFSALGRLKYSRQRACAIQIRMANYAVAMSLFQALCFGYLQISGQAILLNLYPMRYLFCAATVLMYVVMCNAGAISRIGSRIRERSRMR
jgi:hypothetical protein